MGYEKTLHKLWQEAYYWVYMSQESRQCNKCNAFKPPALQCAHAPMTSVPIGKHGGWSVDILEVPVSSNNNCYQLVVQDYFTK